MSPSSLLYWAKWAILLLQASYSDLEQFCWWLFFCLFFFSWAAVITSSVFYRRVVVLDQKERCVAAEGWALCFANTSEDDAICDMIQISGLVKFCWQGVIHQINVSEVLVLPKWCFAFPLPLLFSFTSPQVGPVRCHRCLVSMSGWGRKYSLCRQKNHDAQLEMRHRDPAPLTLWAGCWGATKACITGTQRASSPRTPHPHSIPTQRGSLKHMQNTGWKENLILSWEPDFVHLETIMANCHVPLGCAPLA